MPGILVILSSAAIKIMSEYIKCFVRLCNRSSQILYYTVLSTMHNFNITGGLSSNYKLKRCKNEYRKRIIIR